MRGNRCVVVEAKAGSVFRQPAPPAIQLATAVSATRPSAPVA